MKSLNQKGFTITELAVSITVAGFLVTVLFIATFYFYAFSVQSEASTDLAMQSQSILNQLTDDIRLADGVVSTNSLPDAYPPAGGWMTSDPSNVIIIQSPALDSARNIIYDSSTGFPYSNEFIYFTNGTSMYKRTLANSAATGNTAVTTCPAAQSSPSCPPDIIFSASVSDLNFVFYDDSNNSTATAELARSVYLEVDMARNAYGKNVTLENSTRITLRNQ